MLTLAYESALTYEPGGTPRISVRDGGPARTPCRERARDHGRGLLITEALADTCGWDADPPGTTVWATLATYRLRLVRVILREVPEGLGMVAVFRGV